VDDVIDDSVKVGRGEEGTFAEPGARQPESKLLNTVMQSMNPNRFFIRTPLILKDGNS
jgi:hypothetical protein